MSFKIIGKAFDIPLKGNDKLVFLSLCEYANDEDFTCYPSYTTLMKKATISRGALRDCLNVLEALGFINRSTRSRENGSKASNVYTVNIDIKLDEIAYKNRKNLISKKVQSSDNDLALDAQIMTYPSTNNDLPNGGQSSDNDLVEPLASSLNPYSNPNAHEVEVITDFEIFWKNYPRKIAKLKAKKAWDLKKPDLKIALAALNQQKLSSSWIKNDGQYIPHPTTWINGARWNDEVTLSTNDKVQAVQAATGMSALQLLQQQGVA
jgi:hypothetical protein